MRQFRSVVGLTFGKRVVSDVVGMAEMVDARKLCEGAPIVDDAPDGDAPEADAVIATLSPDEPGARSLSDGALVRERYLQGCFDRFGARAREEDAIEARGRDLGEPFRELECNRMAHLEGRREIESVQLSLDRLGDFATGMPRVDAPEPRRAVYYGSAVIRSIIHPLGRDEDARRGFELPIGREGHPKIFEIDAVRAGWRATFNVIAYSQYS